MHWKKSKLAISELVGMISDRSRAHYIARIHKKKSIEEIDGKESFIEDTLNVNQAHCFRRGKEAAREMEGLTITMCWIPLYSIYLFTFVYFILCE